MVDYPDVCVVCQPIGATGDSAQRTLLDILSAISTVVVLAPDVPPDAKIRENHDVVPIGEYTTNESVALEALGFLADQIRMCDTLARRDEEVVLFFGTTSYLIPILWAGLLGKTVVLEPRGDVPHRLLVRWRQTLPGPIARVLAGSIALLESIGYRCADAIITYTPSMAEELGLGRYRDKLYPSGARYVETSPFDVRVPFEDRGPVVGYLGRLEEGKGVRALAAAVPTLPDDVTVRFIGTGPLADWIETELEDEISSGTVQLRGWVDHDAVPAELNGLRLLVLPSESEGLPTVVLEALACGTPVLATPVSGVPDVVRDGETGFLLRDTDPETISRTVTEILEREDLPRISADGRRLIEEEFSFEAAVDRYRTIVTDVTASGSLPDENPGYPD